MHDEDGELMRVVARKEEAEQLLKLRPEWQAKHVKPPKREHPVFEDAPF
jgi:hypothetical protein